MRGRWARRAGTCVFGVCSPGFVDLDHNLANGCEYACALTRATDDPDDTETRSDALALSVINFHRSFENAARTGLDAPRNAS